MAKPIHTSSRPSGDTDAGTQGASRPSLGRTNPARPAGADFGPNQWLVDELYQRFQADPDSVDRAWWSFFADYRPSPSQAVSPAAAQAQVVTELPETVVTQPAAPSAAPAPGAPATAPPLAARPAADGAGSTAAAEQALRLRGAAARTVANMEASLTVPTATSVRAVPAKLLIDNRIVINNALKRGRGGKVSFTHLIGYAVVRALSQAPEMNYAYAEADGKPALAQPEHVNLGLAIDTVKPDGTRQLLVPSVKGAESLDFGQFWTAYEEIVRKARSGKLTVEDFAGTTISLTNPGTIGTGHSVPRLMRGQGCIIGVGAMEYPAAYQGASAETLARLAVSQTVTLTSTYDHRIIQGAQSGEFLRIIRDLLLGEQEFYDQIFTSLRIPYEPVRWLRDIPGGHENDISKAARVHELIHAYRVRGHLLADTDPLEYSQRKHPDLDITQHDLTLWDLEREFATGGFGGKPRMLLRDILGVLRDSYCRTIGLEYMHIQNPAERAWLQDRVERPHRDADHAEQMQILSRLNVAEAFEMFLQTKYVGQRRFSLEGAESLIPLLDAVLTEAARDKLDEAVIGMAHRGRLNALANIAGKSYAQIFNEFEGYLDPGSSHGSGDVKYHLGTEGVFTSAGGHQLPVTLVANPSHLEAVDPVLEGVARAKQDVLDIGTTGYTVLPILVHGDAAFAGQGVVAETLEMSQLRGYRTGGTIHVIVNNQVGFTTDPQHSRSSVYCTDVARTIQAPIFHVNGDDPEAVVRVARLAYAYREAFSKDVVIDMVCYRRRGHNEADNPSFTQPQMYDLIDAKRSARKLYTESLIGRGHISIGEAEQALRDYQQELERAFTETREAAERPPEPGSVIRTPPRELPPVDHSATPTATTAEAIKAIIDTQVDLPEGFTPHPRLHPQLTRRASMVARDEIDWATGELIALGSTLIDGHAVRLAGQDSRRGTFGQRHATLVDRHTGAEHTPLRAFNRGAAKFHVHDSPLSEFAAVGFEYGYSTVRPDALVCWEAQFGDFVNGAQTIIDEFISAGEQKWGVRSDVVLLLPHGYEGQGPDHSSARIERFLTLCAQDNMTVAMPSTPASYFHLLRWQVLSARIKPMIVFTPKSMLRLKTAASPVADFTSGSFRPVLADPELPGRGADSAGVNRILLCSGKVYYDLAAQRRETQRRDVAIIRTERLYPVPGHELAEELAGYPASADLVWVQEEPANMGAWPSMAMSLPGLLGRGLGVVSRPASSAPASGSARTHAAEQEALIKAALG